MSSYLTAEQYAVLMHPRGIHKDRVSQRDGYSYVEAHDIKAEMIRVFGWERWSWKINTFEVARAAETVTRSTNKAAYYVTALVHGTLTVCAPDGTVLATYDGVHAGSSTHPEYGEAVGNAVTNADSYAFKRAATMALGTQGGLGLYNRGSRDEIVRWTVVKPEGHEDGNDADPEDVPVVHRESMELPEPEADPRVTNRPAVELPLPAGPAAAGVADPPRTPAAAPTEAEQQAAGEQAAQRIRTQALEAPGGNGPRSRHITRLMLEANKQKVHTVPVESLNSPNLVPLKLFLEECLKRAADEERAARAS